MSPADYFILSHAYNIITRDPKEKMDCSPGMYERLCACRRYEYIEGHFTFRTLEGYFIHIEKNLFILDTPDMRRAGNNFFLSTIKSFNDAYSRCIFSSDSYRKTMLYGNTIETLSINPPEDISLENYLESLKIMHEAEEVFSDYKWCDNLLRELYYE
jgi:hypothetical protein